MPKKYKTLDAKIAYLDQRIPILEKWLRLTEHAIKRKAKKSGWTKSLEKQMQRVKSDKAMLQECRNDLNEIKADRKVQRRIMKK